MMKAPTILVTGATGRTGYVAIENLVKRGTAVRALAHREGPKVESLRALGADVVIGDLFNLDEIVHALDGIQSAYFCYPVAPRLIEATGYFAAAAKETGLKFILNISQISARRVAKSHAALNHWVAERIFDWSGIPTTHLRPTFFAEWLISLVDPTELRGTGALKLPLGEGRHAPIAAEDIGRLVAAILQTPEPHAGKIYTVHGRVEMNHYEIAQAMSRALGRQVHYEPVTAEQFIEEGQLKGWGDFVQQHVREVAIDYQNGVFAGEDGIIGQVTGQRPMSVETFIEKNRSFYER
jgi:NAD(P)H dehydrogenase (quinone)